jgi:hypothetical protein
VLFVALLEGRKPFASVIHVGEGVGYPMLAPGHYLAVMIDLGNLLRDLEQKTGGDWWALSPRERTLEQDRELMARIRAENGSTS